MKMSIRTRRLSFSQLLIAIALCSLAFVFVLNLVMAVIALIYFMGAYPSDFATYVGTLGRDFLRIDLFLLPVAIVQSLILERSVQLHPIRLRRFLGYGARAGAVVSAMIGLGFLVLAPYLIGVIAIVIGICSVAGLASGWWLWFYMLHRERRGSLRPWDEVEFR